LAGQKAAVVGQRDRTTPGEPSSLGGSEGDANRRVWLAADEIVENLTIQGQTIHCGSRKQF
ncbi:MAG: hypothetical protein U1A72_25535, partial [Sulfuritalea sp.]|nr:hypothetical protein [Sulfuritalea sp.]